MNSTWISHYLEQLGRNNEDGISRKLRGRRCHKCAARICVGLDADVMALPVECDARLVTAIGEATALLNGLMSYRIQGTVTDSRIDPRSAADIKRASADGVAVLVAHDCSVVMATNCYRPVPLYKRPITTIPF